MHDDDDDTVGELHYCKGHKRAIIVSIVEDAIARNVQLCNIHSCIINYCVLLQRAASYLYVNKRGE